MTVLSLKSLERRLLMTSGVFIILLIPLVGASVGGSGFRYSLWFELLCLGVYLSVRAVRSVHLWSVRRDVLSPLAALPFAYIVWYTLGSIDWIEVPSTWLFGLFDPIPARMWLYYLLGLGGYILGVVLVRRPAERSACMPAWTWRPARARGVLIGLFLLMTSCWIALVSQFGIPGLNSAASEARLSVHGPFYFLFVLSGWTLFILTPLHYWSSKAQGSPIWMGLVLLVTSVLLASLAGRSNIFVPLLTALIVRHYVKTRLNLRSAFIFILVIFLGLSLFGYVRDTSESDRALLWMELAGVPKPLIPAATAAVYVRYSVATFRDVTEMIPEHVPFQHGALTFAPFKTFLPGRQEMSDIFFRNMLGNDFVGVGQPATLLGPLYADFGAPGIFLGMMMFGALLAFSFRRMRAAPTPFQILIYAWILQSGLFGLFATMFPYITTVTLPLLWWVLDRFLRVSAVTEEIG
ncbi:MAG TPA: O-antigen polymerase [Terriglobales bacterium]